MNKLLASFGAAGLLIPIVVLVIDWLSYHGWFPGWIMFIWPTSLILLPFSGYGMDLAKLIAIAVSAGLNALLYVVVGYIGYRIFKSLG